MNLALIQEFLLFCEQEHPQRHANTDKTHTVYTAPLMAAEKADKVEVATGVTLGLGGFD